MKTWVLWTLAATVIVFHCELNDNPSQRKGRLFPFLREWLQPTQAVPCPQRDFQLSFPDRPPRQKAGVVPAPWQFCCYYSDDVTWHPSSTPCLSGTRTRERRASAIPILDEETGSSRPVAKAGLHLRLCLSLHCAVLWTPRSAAPRTLPEGDPGWPWPSACVEDAWTTHIGGRNPSILPIQRAQNGSG